MEEVNFQIVSTPLIMWGILIAAIGGIEDNIKEAKPTLGIHEAHVGVDFPYTEQTFPAVVVGVSSMDVKQAGLYPVDITDPRTQELLSSGEITLELYCEQHNHLMTLVDFISQCYLMNTFEKHKLFHPGTDRSWISFGYKGGSLKWSNFTRKGQETTNQEFEDLYTASTSLTFWAEHKVSIDLARVSGLTIEAMPLNRTV